MKIRARGQSRATRTHVHDIVAPHTTIVAPLNWEECGIAVSGSVSGLGLSGDFNVTFEMTGQELARVVLKAAEQSEVLSNVLKAAIANGDLRRAGIHLK